MVIVLMLAGGISAALLGGIQNYTKPIAERNQEIKLKSTVLEAFGIPHTRETAIALFDENIEMFSEESLTYYRTFDTSSAGKKVYTGTAVELAGTGFWDQITIIIALNETLDTITGFTVVDQAETPGLGGRMEETWFKEQFIGKKVVPQLRVVANRQGDNPNEVDAIVGATETSKALDRIINNGMSTFLSVLQIDN
jgi:RnfABCDGE-type electron transport complex G subunit